MYKTQEVRVLNIESVVVKSLLAYDFDAVPNPLQKFRHSGLAANTKYQRFIVEDNAVHLIIMVD